MDQALEFIQQNIAFAPYIILGLLLLAGLNIPVSEDLMLFTSAILAAKNPDRFYEFFGAVFLGAYLSDLICYGLIGRYFGKRIFQIKFFSKMVSTERMDQISSFYKKYGVITLILGRFIPFGVRNALFITAGIGKMNAWKFALADLFACTISSVSFFFLYHRYGESVIVYVKKGNLILFAFFFLALALAFIKKRKAK